MPESPKFLLSQGKHEKSLELLKMIHTKNTGNTDLKIKGLLLDDVKTENNETIIETIKQVLKLMKDLFTGSYLRITVIMLLIHFTLQFGYYGLWYWFPTLFNELDKFHEVFPNVTKSVCQIISEEIPVDDEEENIDCSQYIPEDSVFINSFIISLSAAPGNLWTILQMDKLGRKFFLVLSMILSGAAAFLIYIVNSDLMNLILSCVFGAVSTMGFNSLDCLSK